MEKQQKLVSSKTPRRFQVGDKLFARNFHGPHWILVKVTKVTGPLSYQVETESGITLHQHVNAQEGNHIEKQTHAYSDLSLT